MVAPELVRNIQNAFECKFETVYGQTETSPLITQHHAGDTIDDICNSVGQPMPQTTVSIRSIEGNKVVPLDTVGEICVQGYCNMIEYHANTEATAETIDKQGWLHTGDIGVMDADGYLDITDRVKDMFINGGVNVYPAEVERLMLAHPEVGQVAVVGIPDDRLGEVGMAFVVPAPDTHPDPADIVSWCRDEMANYKAPRRVEVIDVLPLNASGKVLKFALRQRGAALL